MSATMYGTTPGAGAGQAIFTDDVSLQVFMEHLKRLVSINSRIFCILINHAHVHPCYRLLVHKRIEIFSLFCYRLDLFVFYFQNFRALSFVSVNTRILSSS
jgi:hypothetical protein